MRCLVWSLASGSQCKHDWEQQVIVNFINNAVKYAPESKVILVEVGEEDSFARVAVTDHESSK